MGSARRARAALIWGLLLGSVVGCSAQPAATTPTVLIRPSATPAPTLAARPTVALGPTETPLVIRYRAAESPTPAPKKTQRPTGASVATMQVKAILPLKYVEFEADSAILKDKAKDDIRKQVLPTLMAEEGTFLRIEGRAAKPPNQSDDACLKLSIDRANAVADYLVSIDPRLKERIITRGVGATKAKFRDSNVEEELAQDRIIEFAIVVPMG